MKKAFFIKFAADCFFLEFKSLGEELFVERSFSKDLHKRS